MLANYIKIAWQYVVAEKMVTLISVVSLSLGITCALILFIFLHYEYNRDDYHVNAERLFHVYHTNEAGG